MRTHEAPLSKAKTRRALPGGLFRIPGAGEICGETQLAIDEDPIS